MFLISAAIGTARAYTPQPTTAPIEPNPMLEGNVTFANHTAGWNMLEYQNQYGHDANLTASLDSRTPNNIVILPQDVIAKGVLQQDRIGLGPTWNTTKASVNAQLAATLSDGTVATGPTLVNVAGATEIQWTFNTTKYQGVVGVWGPNIYIPASYLPSTNLAFDFLTIGLSVQGLYSAAVGVQPTLLFVSGSPLLYYYASNDSAAKTSASGSATFQVRGGQSAFITYPLSDVSGATGSTNLTVRLNFNNEPVTATSTYTVTMFAFALTTYPLTFGTTYWNKTAPAVTEQTFINESNVSAFQPSFGYQYIADSGLTLAVAQQASDLPASAVNTAQTPISSGTYVEQVTYSFLYRLPAEPTLSYGAFKVADLVTLAPSQYVSVTYAGTSYLTDYTATGVKGNYTTLLSAASPMTNESWVGTVQYTQAQWNSISSPPGFFTINGIAYYWYVAIGVIAGAIAGGSAWAHRNASMERQIRGRK